MSQSSDTFLSLTRADRLRKCEDLRIIAEWAAARLSVLAAIAPSAVKDFTLSCCSLQSLAALSCALSWLSR